MRTRACLGLVSVVVLGVAALPLVHAAEKSAGSGASAGAAPAPASGAERKKAANPDDDLDDLDSDIPKVDVTAPVPTPAPARSQKATAPKSDDLSGMSMGAESRPDRYEVQQGDTLWSISSRFWGDPYFWPKLWSYNPYIGNAHLIYPGNSLHFNPGNYVRPPSMAVEGNEPAVSVSSGKDVGAPSSGEEIVQPETVAASSSKPCQTGVPFLERKGTVEVRTSGFLREQGFGPLGRITKAPENKLLLSTQDTVYIKFNQLSDVHCGDIYTIYEPVRNKVAHPIFHRRVVGSLYRTLGEVQIVDVNDFVATGRITLAYAEINRGALITQRVPLNKSVEIRPNSKEMEGYIVEALNKENTTLSTDSVIYIDRGQEDGVSVGDSFYVVRQGDATAGLVGHGEKDPSLPYQVIGKVVVVTPGSLVSEAVVTESIEDLEIGDRITSQVN